MSKSKRRQKKAPKRVLALPDLEQSKTAVLTPDVRSGQRTYEHAIRELIRPFGNLFEPHDWRVRCLRIKFSARTLRSATSICGESRSS